MLQLTLSLWLKKYGIHNQGGTQLIIFAGYLLLTSQNPYPIEVYSMAIIDPILVTFGQIQFSQSNYVSFCLCLLYKAF